MHKSRPAVIVIDCPDDDIDKACSFWTRALGRAAETNPKDPKYRDLIGPDTEMRILVQTVDHPARLHLDIETDDIPAEVARLTALGAREIGTCKTWTVMEAPTGHRFCVVRPQRPDFEENATQWPDG